MASCRWRASLQTCKHQTLSSGCVRGNKSSDRGVINQSKKGHQKGQLEIAPDCHVQGFPEKREGSGSGAVLYRHPFGCETPLSRHYVKYISWWSAIRSSLNGYRRWYQLWNVLSSWFHLTLNPMGFDTSPSAQTGRLETDNCALQPISMPVDHLNQSQTSTQTASICPPPHKVIRAEFG